jgi:hypothetical protein
LRTLTVSLAILAALAVVPTRASATHFRIIGSFEGESAPVRANLANCESGRRLTFVWTVIGAPVVGREYDIEIRTTTRDGTTCTFGSATDKCDVREAAARWDRIVPIRRTYTVPSFFNVEGCTGAGVRKAVLFIKDTQPLFPGGTVEEAAQGEVQFDYDFDPPSAPAEPSIRPGDRALTVTWTNLRDAGVAKHRAFWSLDPSRLTGRPTCTGDYRTSCASGDAVATESYRIGGLVNGETVYVALSALDEFDNESTVSGTTAGTPVPVSDFFQYYTASGGQERGGYCFIATAAYGSAWHPLVGSLRRFRDQVLRRTELGRDLVAFYEQWSPAMAEVLGDSAWLRIVFRMLLAPVAVLAWFVVDTTFWEKILLAALVCGLWRLLARRRFRRGALAAGAVLLLAAGGSSAHAQESPRNFYLELKVGAIGPDMDNRPAPVSSNRPYAAIFGEGSSVLTGLELEWQILKDVGSFGISGGILYFQKVGKGIRPDTLEKTGETTVLNVLPLQLNAVYRFDIPMRRHGIPLVPYAKVGFDYYLWWVLNGSGSVSQVFEPGGGPRRGAGGTFGIHAAIGLQFQLDVIDRRMQKSFDEEVGINHSYLFAEMVFSRVDDFNQRSFNFSSNYFLMGLALEF